MRVSHEAIYTDLYVLPRGRFTRQLVRYLRRPHPSTCGSVLPVRRHNHRDAVGKIHTMIYVVGASSTGQ